MVSSKVFRVVFVHLFYNTALFVASIFSSFFLHVVAILISIVLVSHQLALLSALPKLYDMVYLLTAVGLSPGGSSTVHIYTQTIRRRIQNKQYTTILEECGPCPVLASYTLAFTLQPRKKHGKTSVRVAASKNT